MERCRRRDSDEFGGWMRSVDNAPASRPAHALRRVTGVVIVALFVLSAALTSGVAVQATVPGTPGVPQQSSVVYSEDFQNRPAATPVVRLNQYTGATGVAYTAAPEWLTACNGWIASAAQPVASAVQVTDCGNSQVSWNQSQRLAQAIGMYRGQTATQARANYAQTAYTAAPAPGAGKVEFQTASNIPFTATNRFINFSVDVAAINCSSSSPQLQFSLLNSAGAATNVGAVINGCGSTTTFTPPALGVAPATAVQVGTYTSNGALLFTGSSVGVRMINNNGAAAGNDHTIDNIRILDVTPQLDKSFSPATRVTGQTSNLTLTVTNTTELAAKNGWSFTDALPAGLTVAGTTTSTCPAATLTAPVGGSSVAVKANLSANMASCTITVPVTSTTAGTYTNGPSNITSLGLNPPANASVTFTAPPPAPALSIVKSAVPAGFADYVVGQNVTYSFVVTNTGNVPLTNVRVDEAAFSGTGMMSAVLCPSTAAAMAVGAQVTCTASYVVTQADFDAGSLTNSATATGTPTAGATPTSAPSEVTIPSGDPIPALTLVKSASPSVVTAAGQTVDYTFVVSNTGNVTVENIAVNDDEFSGEGELPPIVCPATSLAPSASITCTAGYTVTQADVDAGILTNSATATGAPPTGELVGTDPSAATVTIPPAAAITLSKTAAPEVAANAGDSVDYSFVVTNTGNVTLGDLSIAEGEFTGTGALSNIACPAEPDSLIPGASVTCTAGYVVTQADVDAGTITNTATATGNPPVGPAVGSDPSSALVTAARTPALTLVKSATPSMITVAGQTVNYSFVLTNSGNVTLLNVTADETVFTGSGTLPVVSCPSAAASLAPTMSVTCTAGYAATQADIDADRIINTAVARAISPVGDEVSSQPSSAEVSVFVVELPLTGGTSTEQVLLLGGSGVLISILMAIGHRQHARRRRVSNPPS
jgi:uncharacterized repeat protein (TIGR01451 family)